MTNNTPKNQERDSVYFLKILLFFIIGSMWLRIVSVDLPVPIGFGFGLVFASHDHFQIDRKIEYAVLLGSAILSFVAPIGVILEV